MINSHVDDPGALATFVQAMTQWLINIAVDEASAARSLQTLTADLLRRPWISSSTLPYGFNAFRAPTGKADAVPILLRGIFRYYEALAARTSHEDRLGRAVDHRLTSPVREHLVALRCAAPSRNRGGHSTLNK